MGSPARTDAYTVSRASLERVANIAEALKYLT